MVSKEVVDAERGIGDKSVMVAESETEGDSRDWGERDKDDFPEGGRGWFVILGTFLILFTTYGLINCFGIYQVIYEDIFPDTKPSVISLIGSLQPSIVYLFCIPVGPMMDKIGIRYTLVVGAVIMVVAYMLLSICTEVWQLFLTQGILYSVGAGIAFFTAMSVPSEWFKKRRSLAFGITACGASVGSVVWPFVLQGLVDKIGLAWANRIIGFMYIPLFAISIWAVVPRLQREERTSIWPKWSVLKDWRYTLISCSFGLAMFGFFPPLFFISTFAHRLGVRKVIADNILTILNSCTLIGRLIPLQLADMFGRVNMLIPCMFFIGLFPLVLWLPAKDEKMLLAFAILWGTASGSCTAAFPPALGQLFGIKDNESRLMLLYFMAIPGSMAGSSIASALIPANSDSTQGFDSLIIFSGVVFFGVTAMVVSLRLSYTRKLKVFI